MAYTHRLRTFVLGLLLGALLTWAAPTLAQTLIRLTGTRTNGAAVNIGATDAGYLKVVCQ